MITIICYLVKTDFNCELRYSIDNGNIIENKKSIFDVDVTIENPKIIEYINRKKLAAKIISKADSPFNVYFRNRAAKKPEWVSFWQVNNEITVRTADSIAIVQAGTRQYLICHGHSSHLINPYSVEYDFGLKTALNVIDKGGVRSTDLFTPADTDIRTRKQSSVDINIEDYGINVLNTILKNITGRVKKEYMNLFESVNGADSIKFNYTGSSEELLRKIEDLFQLYNLDTYKEAFGFIDNFTPVKDPTKIDEFKKAIMQALNERDSELILSIPNALNFDGIFDFRFRSLGESHRKVFTHLDISETLFSILDETGKTFADEEELRTVRIELVDHDNYENILTHYPLYNCIYWEKTKERKHSF